VRGRPSEVPRTDRIGNPAIDLVLEAEPGREGLALGRAKQDLKSVDEVIAKGSKVGARSRIMQPVV